MVTTSSHQVQNYLHQPMARKGVQCSAALAAAVCRDLFTAPLYGTNSAQFRSGGVQEHRARPMLSSGTHRLRYMRIACDLQAALHLQTCTYTYWCMFYRSEQCVDYIRLNTSADKHNNYIAQAQGSAIPEQAQGSASQGELS